MLKLVRCDETDAADKSPDVLPFPLGLSRSHQSSAQSLRFDPELTDAAFEVEKAMFDVEMNFLKLKRLMEESSGSDRPRAA